MSWKEELNEAIEESCAVAVSKRDLEWVTMLKDMDRPTAAGIAFVINKMAQTKTPTIDD